MAPEGRARRPGRRARRPVFLRGPALRAGRRRASLRRYRRHHDGCANSGDRALQPRSPAPGMSRAARPGHHDVPRQGAARPLPDDRRAGHGAGGGAGYLGDGGHRRRRDGRSRSEASPGRRGGGRGGSGVTAGRATGIVFLHAGSSRTSEQAAGAGGSVRRRCRTGRRLLAPADAGIHRHRERRRHRQPALVVAVSTRWR